MFHALASTLASLVVERAVLLANHVLAAEPSACERLRGHAGRCFQLHLDGWPALLPPLPRLALRVTPAGMLEVAEAGAEPELQLRIDASHPVLAVAQWSAGERPRVEIQGDAQFAADLSWLIDNLRWDVQDDLARLVGQAPAHEIARIGSALAGGLRQAVAAFAGAGPARR